eukprot:6194252-Pleurochrysis_carterae.AAC.2
MVPLRARRMAVARARESVVKHAASARTTSTMSPILRCILHCHDRGKGMCRIQRPAFAPTSPHKHTHLSPTAKSTDTRGARAGRAFHRDGR